MKHALVLAALGIAVASGPVFASQELAKQKNCLACHAADKKLVGPSYKDVAAKYKGDKDAFAKLAKKIREGRRGRLGPGPDARQPAGQRAGSHGAREVGPVAVVGCRQCRRGASAPLFIFPAVAGQRRSAGSGMRVAVPEMA